MRPGSTEFAGAPGRSSVKSSPGERNRPARCSTSRVEVHGTRRAMEDARPCRSGCSPALPPVRRLAVAASRLALHMGGSRDRAPWTWRTRMCRCRRHGEQPGRAQDALPADRGPVFLLYYIHSSHKARSRHCASCAVTVEAHRYERRRTATISLLALVPRVTTLTREHPQIA